MKRTTVLLCTGALAGAASGQWFDGFEGYDTAIQLPDQSTWEAWGGDAGAAGFFATTDEVFAGSQSCVVDSSDDAVHQYTGDYTAGVWSYTAWQFIPSDAADTPHYFILLNQYDGGGAGTNWSTQLQCDPDRMVVESEFEGSTIGLKTGAWAKFYLIIDLDNDVQTIYYDDGLLVSKSWSEGVSGGGETIIQAVDLWGNFTAYPVYYDDLEIAEVPPFGACCFLDGTCTDDTAEGDCVFQQGEYQGHGSTCALVYCPELGDCGWILTAPIVWNGDTCEESNTCALRSSPDAQFEVILPYDAEWTFSVCNAQWDTYIYLTDACCDEGTILAENDDHPDCGAASQIVDIPLTAGTYYLTIEGFSTPDCGPFPLVISSPCIVECDPDSLPEGEPICEDFYVDVYNVGCNDYDPDTESCPNGCPFTPMACGDIMCGTAGTYTGEAGAVRDTDWYEFDMPGDDTLVTLGGIAEFDLQLLLIDPGIGDCDDDDGSGSASYEIIGSRQIPPCEEDSFDRIMDMGDTGKGWAWAGTSEFEGVLCGSIYNMYVLCGGPDCPADINGDGVVDVLDLLDVLNNWGGSGVPADINGDGVVDVLDLLEVLNNWGPC